MEINPKGKFRARKLNFIQPSQVVQVPYPLKLKALTRFKYFQTREQWKVRKRFQTPQIIHSSVSQPSWIFITHSLILFSDHRFPVQPDDIDDGGATYSDAHFASHDERSRDQEGNGKSEYQ